MLTIHFETKPPCWDRLVAAFGVNWIPGVFCTFDGDIYCFDSEIPDEFLVHESIHVAQQKSTDLTGREFVEKYIEDPEFRTKVELAAYRVHNEYLRATIEDESELFVKLHRNVKAFARITGMEIKAADLLLSVNRKPILS